MAVEKVEIYLLDVKAPKTDAKRFECTSVLTVGSDSACDIVLKDFGLSPLHGRFRFENGVLTFTNLGLDDSCLIGSQKCGQGRRYILEKGDKFICGEVKIIVRKEKVEVQKPEAQRSIEKSMNDDEATDPSAPLGSYEEEDEYEEVEVYVDEDGNEVEAPKKMGFFARLKHKRQIKKEEKQRAKAAKKSPPKSPARGIAKPPKLVAKNKLRMPTASIISRFLGIIFNLIFFFMILKLGFPFLKEGFDFDIFALVAPVTKMALTSLTKAITALEAMPQVASVLKDLPELKETVLNRDFIEGFFAFLLYDITFHLILGVGLGPFLIGLKPDGSFLLIRLLSPIRVVIGWLTLPLLILDAPILLKKASFKEFITFTRVVNRSLILNFAMAFLFLPILVIVLGNTTLLPLVFNLPEATNHTNISLKKSKASFKEVEFYLRSYGFKKEGKSFLNPKIVIIPSLSAKGIPKNSPLTFFSPEKGERVSIQPLVELMDFDEIYSFLKKDPVFSVRHQDLLNTIDQARDKVEKSNQDQLILKDRAQVLIDLLYAAFSIDFQNPIDSLKVLGPFVAPYYDLKTQVLKKLSIQKITRVILVDSSQGKYIKLFPAGPKKSSILLGTSSQGLQYYKVRINKKGKKLSNKILERLIIYPRELKKDYSKLMDQLEKDETQLNRGFMAHAILTRACDKEKISARETRFFTKYFMTMAQKAIKTENETLQTLLLEEMQLMDKALLKLKKRNKDEQLGKLRLGVLRIQKALFQRDYKFFKANRK